MLRRTFGWGTYLVPLFVGAVGLWLVLRDFGDRLPRVTSQQVVGVLLGYLALLATLHLLAALFMYEGDMRAIAQAGHGGGVLGAALSGTLVAGLGGVGAGVVLITWWLIVVALTFGVTVQDGVRAFQYAWGWLRAGLGGSRPSLTFPRPSLRESPGATPAQPTIRTVPSAAAAPPSSPSAASIQPRLFGSGQAWRIPALDDILEPGNGQDFSAEILRQQARIIEETLESLGAPVRVKEINPGPVVTQFGVEPLLLAGANGKETKVKVSRISALADDLALALEAKTLRVEAPIPGKGLVGIEVPNRRYRWWRCAT